MKAQFNENGELIVDAIGRTEFDIVWRYDDGSTKTRKDNVLIITEKDGSLFVDALGRSEFDFIGRFSDGSTETEKNGIRILTR